MNNTAAFTLQIHSYTLATTHIIVAYTLKMPSNTQATTHTIFASIFLYWIAKP